MRQLAVAWPVERPEPSEPHIAEGEMDLCIWFGGGVWDHAAPSIIVEGASGRFSDHWDGRRLGTRNAVYSNGLRHDDALDAIAKRAE